MTIGVLGALWQAELRISLLAVPQSTTSGRRAGHLIWPSGVRSAIVVAAEHSPREPELDWWSSASKVGTLRDGAGELAVPAGLDDLAGLFDPHDRTWEHFPFSIAFVILLLAKRPLE